jgi:hypothetical protein
MKNKLVNIFLLRNNDPFWKSVDYIQCNVKSQVGLGIPIVIKFYADLQSRNPANPDRLVYDYERYGSDVDIKSEFVFCLKL